MSWPMGEGDYYQNQTTPARFEAERHLSLDLLWNKRARHIRGAVLRECGTKVQYVRQLS
jgi:hypothetical protein